MKVIVSFFLALSLVVMGSPANAATQDIHGVKVEDRVDVMGVKLPLNGAGTRYRVVAKVYVAALYTGKKTTSLDELVNQPGPKRLSITMLRDIDANEFGRLLTRGMEDNNPKAEMSKLIPGLLKMSQFFSDYKKLSAGDSFSIDWVPSAGTVIAIKGKTQDVQFKEPEFYKALMAIWLGPVPADFKLKDALLNIK